VLRTALRRLRDEEDGFTLIELMVVVMILAILIVMGLPTFLGVRGRFQDRAAQTDLRNAVLSARILYTDNATFSSATSGPTGLVSIVPNMCYVAGTAATPSVDSGTVACASGAGNGSISVNSTTTQFTAARRSASQSCFVILDATTGTRYGQTTAANCYADWVTTVTVTATTPAAAGW
jgi:type IV pilus assembly protein PilA